jgi:hypothetical protein
MLRLTQELESWIAGLLRDDSSASKRGRSPLPLSVISFLIQQSDQLLEGLFQILNGDGLPIGF